MTDLTQLQSLLDRQAITDLIHAYASGADDKDYERLLSVFAPDARTESAAGVLEGLEAIRASMSPEALAKARAASSGLQFDRSTHQMANIVITLEGDRAHAESSALVYLVGPKEGRDVIVIRGVRYSDDFVRLAEGWRIIRRVHAAVWHFGPTPLQPDG
jgi:3-phenylpropionate/cinnamic acid dioxygenase small subunit